MDVLFAIGQAVCILMLLGGVYLAFAEAIAPAEK